MVDGRTMTDVDPSPTRVAVVGTGAIGRAVARRLLAAGRNVVVWNRTEDRAAELVGAGATPARSVGDAVSSSPSAS